jgi:peptidoglycan/xylan/chitin deacetylase (PgdA/CDA1 family)
VGEGEPELLKTIVKEGHELGIHGYDHVLWQDRVEVMKEEEIEAELYQARAAYERVLGAYPLSSAAPGWRCTKSTLLVQERLKLLYASDVRGTFPFLPVDRDQTFKTLQIPTTLPTMDELLGREDNINASLVSSLKEGLNVHTIHAEVEGRPYLSLFEDFLKEVCQRRVQIVPLHHLAKNILKNGIEKIPHLPVIRGELPGRSGWVACQGVQQN